MFNKRTIRVIIFTGMSIVLLFLIVSGVLFDRQYCMGVPVIKEHELSKYAGETIFVTNGLQFNGEAVAIDANSNTIYVSQSSLRLSHFWELEGIFTSSNKCYSIFFLKNDALANISSSVSGNIPLTMIVSDGTHFQRLAVVISTLPVVRISGEYSHDNEDGRAVYSGEFTMWAGYDPLLECYSTKTSVLEWHLRGASSSHMGKKPWKLSLKDKKGNNNDLNLLGLGEDDDWILNSMVMDDTKIREKFAMDFWNHYLSQGHTQNRMSSGEYIELIINNEYQGLYLLQRRIDQKYLQLDTNRDILFKGKNTWSADSVQEGYEIIYSPYNQESTYQILESVLIAPDQHMIDITSFIKTEVFLNYLSSLDNTGYKNIFYLIQEVDGRFILSFIPWDTDMSMGVTWDDGFVYNYDNSLKYHIKRREHNDMMQYQPRLEEMINSYWKQARKEIYTHDNIQQLLTKNMATIKNSGAYSRETQKWETRYIGADTYEALLAWCEERLTVMDSLYAK